MIHQRAMSNHRPLFAFGLIVAVFAKEDSGDGPAKIALR